MKSVPTSTTPPKKKPTFPIVRGIAVYGGILVTIFAIIATATNRNGANPAPTPTATKVERYACEQATKMQLRDPDTYQLIDFAHVSETSALLAFRSHNGFGGYSNGTAACTTEGSSVRSVLTTH